MVAAYVPPAPSGSAGGSALSRRGIPVPPQAAILASVLALGFGGVIGSALGPGLDTVLASTTIASQIADEANRPAPAKDSGGNGDAAADSGGSDSPAGADTTTTPASTPVTPITTPTPVTPTPVTEDPPADSPPADDPAETDPAPPDESTLAKGTVVRVNPSAGSYSLASGGALSTIHSKKLPKPGSEVSVPVESLFNGTLGEAGKRKESSGPKVATFSGTVTFVDQAAPLYVLSSPGASLPVHVPAPAAGAAPDMPALAASVTVTVSIGPAEPVAPPVPPVVSPVDPAAPPPPA
ncbi:MAG: hypothetical protein H0V25_09330, partial [Solirubrobacterales bacterium]|nr:hypothetical protein [Solirubrobacterales bacterium]